MNILPKNTYSLLHGSSSIQPFPKYRMTIATPELHGAFHTNWELLNDVPATGDVSPVADTNPWLVSIDAETARQARAAYVGAFVAARGIMAEEPLPGELVDLLYETTTNPPPGAELSDDDLISLLHHAGERQAANSDEGLAA